MAELAATKRLQAYVGTPTEDAIHFADQLLIAAEDHFGALCRLVDHDAPVLFADKVLARAGIEACGRAAWLLDPSLDAEKRAARGLTQRFATIKANTDLLKGSDQSEFLRARRDELIRQCTAAGLHAQRGGRTAFVGDPIPSERHAMRSLFGVDQGDELDLGSFSQTWFSRFVHSDPAGLMENMLDPPASDLPEGLRPGVLMKGLGTSSDRVNIVMAMCVLGYVIASGMFLRHQGWSDDGWLKTTANLRGIVRVSLAAR